MANRGGKGGSSDIFPLLGSKSLWMVIAAMKSEGNCFLEGKLLKGSIEKPRHYSADKGLYSQSYGLPSEDHISHIDCENWTIKKAECQRIGAFELWCWRRLLKVPWTAKRSNQSILRKVNPKYSLEGLMLKLNLQYFGHLMWTAD